MIKKGKADMKIIKKTALGFAMLVLLLFGQIMTQVSSIDVFAAKKNLPSITSVYISDASANDLTSTAGSDIVKIGEKVYFTIYVNGNDMGKLDETRNSNIYIKVPKSMDISTTDDFTEYILPGNTTASFKWTFYSVSQDDDNYDENSNYYYTTVGFGNGAEEIKLVFSVSLNDEAKINTKYNFSAGVTSSTLSSVEFEDAPSIASPGFNLEVVDEDDAAVEEVEFTLTDADGKYYTQTLTDLTDDRFKSTRAVISTNNLGKFTFNGMTAGTYTLTNVKTKSGYNLLSEDIKVEIDSNYQVSFNDEEISGDTLTIKLFKETELPATGGNGIIAFHMAGGLCIVTAIMMLFKRKRVFC